MPSAELASVALVVLTVVLATTLQRVAGLGIALVLSPVLTLLLGASAALVLTNAAGSLVAGMLTVRSFRDVTWRSFAVLTVSGMAGVVPGALLVSLVSEPVRNLIVGGAILFGLSLSAARLGAVALRGRTLAVAGVLSGLMGASAGVAGPPLAIYAVASRWDSKSFVATVQPALLLVGVTSLGANAALAGPDAPSIGPVYWLAAFLACLVGMVVGEFLAPRVSARASSTLLSAVAGLGAITVLSRGLIGLSAG